MKKTSGNAVIALVTAAAALLSIPFLFSALSGRLDDSWRFGIHQAKLKGLVFGMDIVFTFGPLGFLTYPIYIDRGLWLGTLLYTSVTHLLFWTSLYLFLKRCRAKPTIVFYTAVVAVMFIQAVLEAYGRPGESYNYFYLLLWAYWYADKREKDIALLVALSLVASLFFYVKFSLGLAVCIMFMTFVALLAMEKRYFEAVLSISLFMMFTLITGMVTIGGMTSIAAFFHNSWAIADGYADAMAVDGPRWKFFAAVLAWVLYGAFVMRSVLRRNYGDMRFLALSLGFLFMNYKHSAGNGSLFEWDFFVTWGMVFTLYYVKKLNDGDAQWIEIATLMVSVFLVAISTFEFVSITPPIKQLVNSRISQLTTTVQLIGNKNPSLPHELNKKRLSAYYSLSPQTLQMLKDHTVDVFTIDAAIAGYYGLNWHPRPIFQSYSAYTAYLDSLNEKFLSDSNAPEFLLYAPRDFDQKSAILFEPATYRKILTGYKAVARDSIFWILKKRQGQEPVNEENLGIVKSSLDVRIPFPSGNRHFFFARIYAKYNLMGDIVRVLYRAPNIFIQFYHSGIPTRKYKFCFNAANGIDLNAFFEEGGDFAADEFAITTPYPAFFDKTVRVEFFRVLK